MPAMWCAQPVQRVKWWRGGSSRHYNGPKGVSVVGAPGVEKLLHGIFPGDNCVWRMDRETIGQFRPLADSLVSYAVEHSLPAVYFRFGSHAPLCEFVPGLRVQTVRPQEGFESFITAIHEVIRQTGKGAYYLFDSLSELSDACYSDRMIGNFFMLTCPYLREFETIAYFVIYRSVHSYHAMTPITDTVQVLIDLYSYRSVYYLRPFKVDGRHSSTMYMLHEWTGREWAPIAESGRVAEVIQASPWLGLASTSYRMIGVWDRVFIEAERVQMEIEAGSCPPDREQETLHKILRLIVSQDLRIFELAARYFSISDILRIWKRMIGTGRIGGKSVGMLLARSILLSGDAEWTNELEAHDSFFIGSDVFYTYLVINNCWWARQRQKDPETFLDGNEDVRRRILAGSFPDYILHRFSDMLDYFGYSPIIVRSSSLLEDNFGNAFAGKYESVFCANQGTKDQRMRNFLDAVRLIYASTMSDVALRYRRQRGVLDKDEQMALLVQRVSGAVYGRYYLPQVAGVAFSMNPYAWSPEIDPKAGVLRMVFGLGTRAVDRFDDDYTRIVALNAPDRRPEGGLEEVRRYAQHNVDAIDLEENKFVSVGLSGLVPEIRGRLPLEKFVDNLSQPVLTFAPMLLTTDFAPRMRGMLEQLRKAYGTEVDVEFTANFTTDGYKLNLVQCRPFQMTADGQPTTPLPELRASDILLDAHGAVIGPNRAVTLDWIVYVVPESYGRLSERARFSVARAVGKILHHRELAASTNLLIGPGRWGTKSPSLGVPVSFPEINTVSILCEMNLMHPGLSPDLSLGTHFFNELVETDMLYVAYFVEKPENRFAEEWFLTELNCLDGEPLEGLRAALEIDSSLIRVLDARTTTAGGRLVFNADAVGQRAVLHLVRG